MQRGGVWGRGVWCCGEAPSAHSPVSLLCRSRGSEGVICPAMAPIITPSLSLTDTRRQRQARRYVSFLWSLPIYEPEINGYAAAYPFFVLLVLRTMLSIVQSVIHTFPLRLFSKNYKFTALNADLQGRRDSPTSDSEYSIGLVCPPNLKKRYTQALSC